MRRDQVLALLLALCAPLSAQDQSSEPQPLFQGDSTPAAAFELPRHRLLLRTVPDIPLAPRPPLAWTRSHGQGISWFG